MQHAKAGAVGAGLHLLLGESLFHEVAVAIGAVIGVIFFNADNTFGGASIHGIALS